MLQKRSTLLVYSNDDLYLPTIAIVVIIVLYLMTTFTISGVLFGFPTTEYSASEGQGSLAVSVLKLTEASQAASVRFLTRDVLVGKPIAIIIMRLNY